MTADLTLEEAELVLAVLSFATAPPADPRAVAEAVHALQPWRVRVLRQYALARLAEDRRCSSC